MSNSFVSLWTVTMRIFCPWDFLGKNTGMDCHFLLQGIFWPRDQTHVSCIGRWILYHWATREAWDRQWRHTITPFTILSLDFFFLCMLGNIKCYLLKFIVFKVAYPYCLCSACFSWIYFLLWKVDNVYADFGLKYCINFTAFRTKFLC